MAVYCTFLPPSLAPFSISHSKSSLFSLLPHGRGLPPPPAALSTLSSNQSVYLQRNQRRRNQIWRVSVAAEEVLPSDTTPLDAAQQIVSAGDDGVGRIVSALLLIAFVILSLLTVGVIYIGVTDFLQKREGDKYEKEAATQKKKGGKKGKKVRARAGPRGFGQKINDDDDNDEASI